MDNVVVRSWPETVRLDDDGPHREVVGEVRRFEAWADRRGGSVLPPFETRTRSSIVEDEGVDVLVTPVLCLALYRGERLVAVFPHSADGETYTVERAIDRLEAGELPRPLCGNPVSPDAGSCPDCGTATLNGQGVSVGPDCAWTGSLSAEGWSELETSEEVGGGEANAPRASDG